MAATIPYTYIQCPCTSDRSHDRDDRQAEEGSIDSGEDTAEEEADFDPRSPRANYSLYPIENLLYCEICTQIRCQRCIMDEIVTWFCPNCLFEVPSSTVKSEGNRCTRSCFQCPSCIAPLSVIPTITPPANGLLGAEPTMHYVLSCACCSWSSLEIGIKFDKPNGIYGQLARIRNGGQVVAPAKERALGKEIDRRHGERRPTLSKLAENSIPEEEEESPKDDADEDLDPDLEMRFASLRAFYQGQMSAQGSSDRGPFPNEFPYASPNALSRIMNLYTSVASPSTAHQKRPDLMREALSPSEGLLPIPSPATELAAIRKLHAEGWSGTVSTAQREAQIHNHPGPHFAADLRPVPYLLRTKRTKRCRTCKHIVARPEAKVQTSRFRMKMIAASYIPTLTLRPLPAPGGPSPPAAAAAQLLLEPRRTQQFVLTVKNPLYERVRVTLAAKAHTPGRFRHAITLLCPQFEVGASREAYADVWDDALADPAAAAAARKGSVGGGEAVAEAGKVFERGRNSVGVVVEVVPGSLAGDRLRDAKSEGGEEGEDEIGEDEDVLEIPVRVRVEWEAELGEGEKVGEEKGEGGKVKREVEYWVVLGVGRVAKE